MMPGTECRFSSANISRALETLSEASDFSDPPAEREQVLDLTAHKTETPEELTLRRHADVLIGRGRIQIPLAA